MFVSIQLVLVVLRVEVAFLQLVGGDGEGTLFL